jgi:hypothetical protein
MLSILAEFLLKFLVRGLLPRHALFAALPPIPRPLWHVTRKDWGLEAEPPKERDAAEPRHEESLIQYEESLIQWCF